MKQALFNLNRTYRFKRFVRRTYAAFNSMHREVSIGVIGGCMLVFAHIAHASAQNQTAVAVHDSIFEQELDELVVTSSKAELAPNQTARLVTVITRDEIARQPAQSIQDLLKNVAGLDVRQRGPNGVLSDISVRGSTFDQVTILLNGSNLTNPQTGHYSFDLPVNLSDIERIEIIHGPASLLYGAGAFSGGVNIVTKKDANANASLKAEGGMHNLWGTEARGAFQTPSSTHSLSAGYSASAGYIPDSDYELLNVFWQSRFHADNSKLDVQLGFNEKAYGANTFYSPSYPNQFDETQSLFASVKGESGTMLKFVPQIYWNRHYDCFRLYREGTPDIPDWYSGANNHYSDVFGFNLNVQYKGRYGITNMGGELRNEGIFSNNLGKQLQKPLGKYTKSDNRTNIGYSLEHTYLYKGFTLGMGVLVNYNTAYNNDVNFYPSFNIACRLTDELKIFTSWNNATRMPTFTDLYYVDPSQEGFPDLQPEKSEAFDAGFKYVNSFLSFSVDGFYEKGRNLIDWVKENPQDKLKATNLTSVNKAGFEANASFSLEKRMPQLPAIHLNLGYIYVNQSRNAGNLISNYVLDYLRHKLVAGLTHPVYKGLSADWQFRRQQREGTYSQLAGRDEEGKNIFKETAFPAFSLLDLKLNWKLNNVTVYLTINNLFNVSYYDRGNIPQPGFWLIGGARWTKELRNKN
jgi:iron complex outermembrane receptor protein